MSTHSLIRGHTVRVRVRTRAWGMGSLNYLWGLSVPSSVIVSRATETRTCAPSHFATSCNRYALSETCNHGQWRFNKSFELKELKDNLIEVFISPKIYSLFKSQRTIQAQQISHQHCTTWNFQMMNLCLTLKQHQALQR